MRHVRNIRQDHAGPLRAARLPHRGAILVLLRARGVQFARRRAQYGSPRPLCRLPADGIEARGTRPAASPALLPTHPSSAILVPAPLPHALSLTHPCPPARSSIHQNFRKTMLTSLHFPARSSIRPCHLTSPPTHPCPLTQSRTLTHSCLLTSPKLPEKPRSDQVYWSLRGFRGN